MKRMEIYSVALDGEEHIQGGFRPCLIVSNSIARKYSPVVIVVPITKQEKKNYIPTHMKITGVLREDSTILFEQILTVNKSQISYRLGELPADLQKEAEEKIKISLGLTPAYA